MIVVDASALLEVLLRRPSAGAIEERLFASGQSLHAPHVIDLEVAQVLRRFVLTGAIKAAHGDAALAVFTAFSIQRYPHAALLPRVWALRHNLTACDAAYVALAEALDRPLLTGDRRLASASGHTATIEVV